MIPCLPSPTFYWKTKTEIIWCEIAESPVPKSLNGLFTDILKSGLPIRIIIATPEPTISVSEYRDQIRELKKLHIGFLCVKDINSTVELHGIPINAYITEPNLQDFRKKIRPLILRAYDLYVGGDPRHGIQELGQIIESIIFELGNQACYRRTLRTGGYCTEGGHYAFASLVEDLMRDRVIDCGVLGRCRGFVDDRNDCSHPIKSLKVAKRILKLSAQCWGVGSRILSELPETMENNNYRFRL